MGGWLSKAKSVLGRRRREPEPFAVVSSAGRAITGMREAGHQVVTCPLTGERLFVLPMDVYPTPTEGPATKRAAKAGTDGTSTAAKSAGTTSTGKGRSGRRTKGRSNGPAAAPRRPAGEVAREKVSRARERLAASMRRAKERALQARQWFTPLRTTVVAMGLVVVVTAAMVLRSRARERAEVDVRQATEAAWKALAEQDFDAADSNLQRAVSALDVLGRDDPAIRHAAREVHTAMDLNELPLVDVVVDRDRFDDRHAGRWIVLDASIHLDFDDDASEVVRVEYPLEVDGAPVDVFLASDAFPGLEVPSDPNATPLQVLFAARLDTLQEGQEPFPRWTMRLKEPFLWVHPATLPATGFPVLPETETVLARQAAVEDVEPVPVQVPQDDAEEPR